MKFQLFVFRRTKLEIIGLILIATFLLLNSTSGETFWDKKIKELSHEDLGEIARELLLYGDPNFPRYDDIFYRNYRDPKELLNALNTEIEINQEMMEIIDIDERKIEGLTYGVYILNAINEKNLVEISSKFAFKPDKATGQFFQKLADNLAYWKPQIAKIILEELLKGVFVATGSPGLSIGVSTLGLATNLTLIGIGINKLNDLLYERGFWHYFQSRKLRHDYNTAWEVAKITGAGAITNKNEKQTEEYFKSLWDTYGENISDDGLKEDFKAKQRKKLKTLLLYALGAQAHPVISSPLKITPPPYQEGDEITAEFTITNKGKRPIFLKTITVGGRYENKPKVIDFTKRYNIKLDIDESYEYHGILTLAKAGNYHFFCAYQTPDGKWNPSVDLAHGLTDEDRTEAITAKVKEEEPPKKQITKVSKSRKNYYPLNEGKSWEYQVFLKEEEDLIELQGSGKMVMTNFPQRELKGKEVTPQKEEIKIVRPIIGSESYTTFSFVAEDQTGIYQFASQRPEQVEPEIKMPLSYLIKYPIKVGAGWWVRQVSAFKPKISIPVKTTIESIDEVVTVPAGTFKECLRIKGTGFAEEKLDDDSKVEREMEFYSWYTPNVGLIKMIGKEKRTRSGGPSWSRPTKPDSRQMTMQLERFKDLAPGLTDKERTEGITVKAKEEAKPTLSIENWRLTFPLPYPKVYEMKEAPVEEGDIFLIQGKEGVRVIGPEISPSPQMKAEVRSIFHLADEEISRVTDAYIVRVNPYLTYDIEIDDFEDEIDLARVELSKETNTIKSNFIFLASSQASGNVWVKITAIVNRKGVASSGPIGIEVRPTRESGVIMQKFTPVTETLSLGLPTKVAIDFETLWLIKKNYNEAEKLLTPEMLKQFEAGGGLKQIAEDFSQEFQKIEVAGVKEEIEDAQAKVTVIVYFNGRREKAPFFLRKIDNEWKISLESEYREPEKMVPKSEQEVILKKRESMVSGQIEARGIKDKRVLEAMRAVSRHKFVSEDLVESAYEDRPLPIGCGQNISQPYLISLTIELLELNEGDKVLEVGAKSGYQAAILSEIVTYVYTIGVFKELATSAKKTLNDLGYTNVKLKVAEGYYGWPEQAPFDAIIVNYATKRIPPSLIEQLKDGGKMCIPVGSVSHLQKLILVKKENGEITAEDILPVRVSPMPGEY